MSDTSLITFKAIANFTGDLASVFGEEHRPLKLYAHLISKTTLAHDKPIQKHIEAFREFCIENRDAIASKQAALFTRDKIIYSKRVYFDMKEILNTADAETQVVIWKHLLTISAFVDPTGKARKILKEQQDTGTSSGEVNFLSDIISKVESQVDPNANPMEAVSSIMQSGIFTDLVQGMGDGLQDGSLDLNKLMGTVQNMVTKLSDEKGDEKDDQGTDQAMNLINTMMGNLQAGSQAPANNGTQQPMPDLAGMLGPMMGAMMGNANGGMPDLASMMGENNQNQGNPIENLINAQVEAARASGALPNITKNDEEVPKITEINKND
jgi:hypothetical protein